MTGLILIMDTLVPAPITPERKHHPELIRLKCIVTIQSGRAAVGRIVLIQSAPLPPAPSLFHLIPFPTAATQALLSLPLMGIIAMSSWMEFGIGMLPVISLLALIIPDRKQFPEPTAPGVTATIPCGRIPTAGQSRLSRSVVLLLMAPAILLIMARPGLPAPILIQFQIFAIPLAQLTPTRILSRPVLDGPGLVPDKMEELQLLAGLINAPGLPLFGTTIARLLAEEELKLVPIAMKNAALPQHPEPVLLAPARRATGK